MSTPEPTDAYTYRERVPLGWWVGSIATFVVLMLAAAALSGRELAVGSLGPPVLLVVAFVLAVLGYMSRYRVRVTSQAVEISPAKLRIDLTRLHRAFLAGPADVRRIRKRLTPSRRIHCPPWHRQAAWILLRGEDGLLVEYLVAAPDPDRFAAAMGRGWDDVAQAMDTDVPPAAGGA